MFYGKQSASEVLKASTSRYKSYLYKGLLALFVIAVVTFVLINVNTEEDDDDQKIARAANHSAVNFNFEIKSISKNIAKYRISSVNRVDDQYEVPKVFLTFREVFTLLAEDNFSFTSRFVGLFTGFESKSYFFECIPVTKSSFDSKEFEFVLIAAPALDEVSADAEAFREHFHACNDQKFISFPNLGRDAVLVVPCPQPESSTNDYAHLARFMRSQSKESLHELWKKVAVTVLSEIDNEARPDDVKLWLSTSGLGVYWLHVRLDQRPKYYNYAEYKV